MLRRFFILAISVLLGNGVFVLGVFPAMVVELVHSEVDVSDAVGDLVGLLLDGSGSGPIIRALTIVEPRSPLLDDHLLIIGDDGALASLLLRVAGWLLGERVPSLVGLHYLLDHLQVLTELTPLLLMVRRPPETFFPVIVLLNLDGEVVGVVVDHHG
mmetsp:Transcript_16865/g.16117  ORF Transcript_16865/g.16117 Transcript_16865/m.16117 type:complete len:157 (+) Transcript_16865:402-872(+)